MRLLRALAAGALLAAGLLTLPTATTPPVAGVGPLPECRIDDIFTEPRGYDDWAITQVDWILSLGPDYKPPDLVSVRDSGISGGGLIRKVVIDDLTAMVAAAKKNGTPLVSWSPYRGYAQQVKLFNGYAGWNGTRYTNFDDAITFSARPGHSEHQTGLTIDFVAVGDDGLTSNWEVTRTGGWMAKNAWKYGWLMSYPKGKKDVTCYSYEPWHYRYVGRDLAAKIHDSGLTIREYLWANFTQLDADCVARPGPTIAPEPALRSCSLAVASASPASTGPPMTASQPASTGQPTPASPTGTGPPAVPGQTAAPTPTSALDGALPIGIGLILALLGLVAFGAFRQSRKAARRRR
jgi:D-alanyl-D-alanine carboxypeptidase